MKIIVINQSIKVFKESDRFIGPFYKLALKGHELHLLTPIKKCKPPIHCHYINQVNLPFPSIFFFLQCLLAIRQITKLNEFDFFVFYQEVNAPLGLLLKIMSHGHLKLVYYAHGDSITIQELSYSSVLNKIKTTILKKIEKFFFGKIDLVIAVSESTKRLIQQRVREKNSIVVLYNNVLSYQTPDNSIFFIKKSLNEKIIGYMGDFSKLKNVDILLYCLAFLLKNGFAAQLILVGDGDERKNLLKKSNDLHILNKVTFTGWVDHPLSYLKEFDLLVVPSFYEGCPSVILEAFSLGIPVIGAKTSGIIELLHYEELLFDPKDPKDLANKIEFIFKKQETYQKIKALINERKKIFTFDHTSRLESILLQNT